MDAYQLLNRYRRQIAVSGTILIVLTGCMVLTGCQTKQPANAAMVQKLGETCQGYGFKPGTDQFNACIFQLDQNRITQNREARLRVGAALQGVGAGMQNANRGQNCTYRRIGNSVYQNCF